MTSKIKKIQQIPIFIITITIKKVIEIILIIIVIIILLITILTTQIPLLPRKLTPIPSIKKILPASKWKIVLFVKFRKNLVSNSKGSSKFCWRRISLKVWLNSRFFRELIAETAILVLEKVIVIILVIIKFRKYSPQIARKI